MLARRLYSLTVQQFELIPKVPANSLVFLLLQPTGRIHLGNYLGAIKSWKSISETDSPGTKYVYGVADLHAITLPQDPHKLRQCRMEAVASLLALGLDTNKCTIFHQSSVPAHAELAWILMCITGMGQLNRMTQWKLKVHASGGSLIFEDKMLEKTKAGLLTYPVLMAADILLYNSTHVPVGQDQLQHLELTRQLALSFNNQYNTNHFVLPNTLLSPMHKILSLRNPEKKMLKLDPDQTSCIYVTDEPDVIAKKIRRAVTDSIQGPVTFDPINRPGVSNMVTIVAGLTSRTVEQVVGDLAWIENHKQLKDHVSELLIEEFSDQRQLYHQLMNNKDYLASVVAEGTAKANDVAQPNLAKIKTIVGLC